MLFVINEQAGVNGVINSEEELREYIESQSDHVRGMAAEAGNPNWLVCPSFITETHTVAFRFGSNYSVEEMMGIIGAQLMFEDMRILCWDDHNASSWGGDDLIRTHVLMDGKWRWVQILTPELCAMKKEVLQGTGLDDTFCHPFRQIGKVSLMLGTDGEL
jgi:hypothetical protein